MINLGIRFLPSANKVCEGYVFTAVCLFTGGMSDPLHAGIHTPLSRYTLWQVQTPTLGRYPLAGTSLWAGTPPGRYTPWQVHLPGQVHTPWVGTPPRACTSHLAGTPLCTVHAGIRSTSGWYTSHWNAFLFWKCYQNNWCFYGRSEHNITMHFF